MTKQTKIILFSSLAIAVGFLSYWLFRIEIKDYFISKHVIYWTNDVKINYADFNDEIDQNSDSNIWYYHGLYLKSTNIEDAFVRAIFDKNKSWVKDTTQFNYQKAMKLQKIRFDLYEVFARKFNKEIDKIRYKSGKKFSDLEKIGDSIYAELYKLDDEIYESDLTISETIDLWRPKIDFMLSETKK
ncbi:MAG: hypothetical protein AAFP76_11785 [Bacteroidota bacterium]